MTVQQDKKKLLIMIANYMNFNNLSLVIFIIILIHMFYFQIRKLNINDEENCLKIFKSNNMLGLIVFSALIAGKL